MSALVTLLSPYHIYHCNLPQDSNSISSLTVFSKSEHSLLLRMRFITSINIKQLNYLCYQATMRMTMSQQFMQCWNEVWVFQSGNGWRNMVTRYLFALNVCAEGVQRMARRTNAQTTWLHASSSSFCHIHCLAASLAGMAFPSSSLLQHICCNETTKNN